MPRGKKFDAAEKHFDKKRIQYEREIASLKLQLDNAHNDTKHFRQQAEFLESENASLKEWIERLLEYTELSKEDIKQACDKDKKSDEDFSRLMKFGIFGKAFGEYLGGIV